MAQFWLCFVPLFVAVDAVGTLPLLVGMTSGLTRRQFRRVVVESVLTATVVAVLFLIGGKAVLRLLGVTVHDFMVAGGVLLFIISLKSLLSDDGDEGRLTAESMGAVPLGVPLMAGPALLTTMLLLLDQYGASSTVMATIANMLLAGGIFLMSDLVKGALGQAGVRTLSKVASLVLAAFAVMFVRKGLAAFLAVG